MELLIYIENDCIDAVSIEPALIVFPGYLSHFVKMLRGKNHQLIFQSGCEPEFLLRNIDIRNPKPIASCSAPKSLRSCIWGNWG